MTFLAYSTQSQFRKVRHKWASEGYRLKEVLNRKGDLRLLFSKVRQSSKLI